ncbi:MAG: DMT family protein [Bdellovibrionales bacterium]|nr:DMT family protein [Bdellovibrionales bacterium]
MNSPDWITLRTVLMLFLSNIFMTAAWYGHLRYKSVGLLTAILISWLIALPEYALQVPANRMGYGTLSAFQLKILQECITLLVFLCFARFWLGEAFQIKHLISFSLIIAAVAVAFSK